jgi:predicted O-methyltransferase YrrM
VSNCQQPKQPDLDALRASDFDALFERYISRIDGWLSRDEAAFLFHSAKAVREGCIVEVGSYRGRSTTALGFGVNAGAQRPVYAFEPHEPFKGVLGGEFGPEDRGWFMRAMIGTGLYRHVRLVNLSSQFVAASWPMPVELLFIDADHRYAGVKRDFECWRGRLAGGALVVFDDAADPAGGPGQLTRELVAEGFLTLERAVGKMACLRRARAN